MKNIIIFGTGAVAAELESYIGASTWLKDNNAQIKGFTANDEHGVENWTLYGLQKPYLGALDEIEITPSDYFILALANPTVKRKIVEFIKNKGGNFITYIHHSAIVAPTAQIGLGCVIYPQVIIGPNVVLGDFNQLTSQSIVSHDGHIGNYNFFATCLLCGYNTVGDDNYFGIRATTMPSVSIGNRNQIHAGMIIEKDVPDDSTLFYKYKEKILAVPKLTNGDC